MPAIVLHWAHLVCIVVLALTGFFIETPLRVLGLTMATAQWIHYVFMYLVLIVLAARVYWACYGRGTSLERGSRVLGPDYRNFLPQEENRGQFRETVKYYLFLRRTRPATAKFDTFAKTAYVFWGCLLLFQAYTGFALYGPTYSWPVFATGAAIMGGLGAVRAIHYLVMWVFIITTVAHVYLTAAENAADLPLMLWWRESPDTGEPAAPDDEHAQPARDTTAA